MSKNTIDTPSPIPPWAEKGDVMIPYRKIPLPKYISDEAKTALHSAYVNCQSEYGEDAPKLSSAKIFFNHQKKMESAAELYKQYALDQFNSRIERLEINGVPFDVVYPEKEIRSNDLKRSLIHICGGVNFIGSNALQSAIYLANYSASLVYVPRYRALPTYTLEEQNEDILSLYSMLLENCESSSIGIFGESSGSSATVKFLESLLCKDIALPGAIALLGLGGLESDSDYLNQFLDPAILQQSLNLDASIKREKSAVDESKTEPEENNLERNIDSYKNFPPTIFVSGSRDVSLDNTVLFHNLLEGMGVDVDLSIYEGMIHAHHTYCYLPEAQEAYRDLTRFFTSKLT